MKKLLTLMFTLIISVGTIFAESGMCGENLTWNLSNGTLTISGTGAMTDFASSSSIPWKDYRKKITNVIINSGVTSIGEDAFSSCESLISIEIPNTVTSVGRYAFNCCKALTSVTIPNGVTSIKDGTFFSCTGLTSVTIPNSVTSIENSVCLGCKSLRSVTIPNSVISIGNEAFSGCAGMSSLTIGNSVTSIGNNAFFCCTHLTSVTIPNSVISIGNGAFYCCDGLTSITCMAVNPPALGDEVLFNKTTPIYVHAGSVSAYKNAYGWKDFKNILPLGAKETGVNTLTIKPDMNSANIIWPAVSNAYTYELVIKDASGNVVCALTFNSKGQITAFTFNAPARNNESQQVQSAGFVYTVTGLEPGTQYGYSIVAKNESGETLNTETGTFNTKTTEALENTAVTNVTSRKILRNGQVLILRGNKTFNASGVRVK